MAEIFNVAMLGDNDKLIKLLASEDNRAHINDIEPNYGCAPLHAAVINGCEKIISTLIEYGANANVKDIHGVKAATYAVRSGKLEYLRILIDFIDVNEYLQSGETLLHIAAEMESVEIVRLLLSRNADKSKININGDTPILTAAYKGCIDCIQLFLERGDDINSRNSNTLLHAAARQGHLECCKFLLERGADKFLKNTAGLTPSEIANDVEIKRLIDEFQDISHCKHCLQ